MIGMYEGYQVKTQTIDYPIIEKNRYNLFYKGIINVRNIIKSGDLHFYSHYQIKKQ